MSNSPQNSLVNYTPSAESSTHSSPAVLQLTEDIRPDSPQTNDNKNEESEDVNMTDVNSVDTKETPKASNIDQAIQQLREQLEILTLKSVNSINTDQFNKNHSQLKGVKAKLKYALECQKLLQPQNEEKQFVVPPNLPLIQWKGGPIQNENVTVFENVKACLRKFETVVQSYGLNVNWHYKRLLPICLSDKMNCWFSDYLTQNENVTWETMCKAINEKYGISNDKLQQAATNKLLNIKMGKNEHIDHFVDRFNALRNEAQVFDEHMLCQFFLEALQPRLYEHLSLFNATASSKKRNKIKYLVEDAQRLYNCMETMQWKKEHTNEERKRTVTNQNERFSKRAKLSCKNHPNLNNHTTQQCRYKGNKRPLSLSYAAKNNLCYKCNQPYTKGHLCQRKVVEKTKSIVPMDVDDSSDEENDLKFNAVNESNENSECKQNENDFSLPPKDLLNKTSIYLPLKIENVKTFALLDTGSTISLMSISLANYLNVNKINYVSTLKNNFISLGKSDIKVKRIGKTKRELEIFYNDITCHAKFEIFDTNDVHVIIGMDIMRELGIGITGLTYDWETPDHDMVPDPVDPKMYTPNESPHGSKEEREKMYNVLQPFIDANANLDPRGHCNLPGSLIELPLKQGIKKPYSRQYDIPLVHHQVVRDQIQKWINHRVIQRAAPNTAFNSSILVVKKKNAKGEYTGDVRVVTDCRRINASLDQSRLDTFPLPLISDIHRKMSQCKLFTTIDLSACFHSFKIKKGLDRQLTSFTFDNVQYSFRKAPFGLIPLSSVVQRTLTTLFSDLPYVTVFVDDISVSTHNDLDYHIKCVKKVLSRLTQSNLRINVDKLHLAQTCIYILGFCISGEAGLMIDQRKITNIMDWSPVPKNAKELSSRLGLANFFRAHIPRYSMLTACLDKLRNAENLSNEWTDKHTNAMKKLQEALANAPVLSYPDFHHRFKVVTDSSAYGIGAALYQVINEKIKYIGFIARTLSPSEKKWGSTRRELTGVAFAFSRWHSLLKGRKFDLYVDNHALLYLKSKEKINNAILNVYETIYEMDFTITYCKGIDNILADRLSRIFVPNDTKMLKGGDDSRKRKKFVSSKENESEAKTRKKQKLNQNEKESVNENESLSIRAIQKKGYTTPNEEQRKEILLKSHLLGHYGIHAMEKIIHEDFNAHWPKMRNDITSFISKCNDCRQFNQGKHVYHPPKSILPNNVWDHIVYDLGTFNVTSERGNNFILVVVDLFSRFTILRPLKDKTAVSVAKELVFLFSLMGYPKIISHDNGKEVSNKLIEAIVEQS